MTHRNKLGPVLAFAALAVAAPALAASAKADYSVRNDTGKRIDCYTRVGGSSQTDRVVMRAGQTWSGRYSASKGVRLRCQGVLSTWHRLSPGIAYRAVEPRNGVILIRAGSS
jgi:hypothetical protein